MKKASSSVIATTTFLAASLVSLRAQDTREEAVSHMRKVEAREMDPTYTKAAPYAQKLIDEALAKHTEVVLIAIHAAPPGHKNLIVASNFGRIGKIGDEDDMRCINTGKNNLEVDKTGKHFEDGTVLQDAKGETLGALGVVFNYKPGDDKNAMAKIADQIKEEIEGQAAGQDRFVWACEVAIAEIFGLDKKTAPGRLFSGSRFADGLFRRAV